MSTLGPTIRLFGRDWPVVRAGVPLVTHPTQKSMAVALKDGDIRPASLTTQAIGPDSHVVRFNATNGVRSRVMVELGNTKALISRQEIAALAALFPVEREHQRPADLL